MARDLLNDTSSESESEIENEVPSLKINEDFARRFEHNKKREELQKLEDKYGNPSKKRKRDNENGSETGSSDDSSTDSEDEDDLGELATTALDSEILATLNAIKSKDPRVYDGKTSFYVSTQETTQPQAKPEKPLYLRDYHRENLLNGAQPEQEHQVMTYDEEQAQLKKAIVDEMHAAASESEEDELLVAKTRARPTISKVILDVEAADRDPETFLSNFMSSRAWVPTEQSVWQPFESDDEEDERRANEFEEAWNMRFEDPNKSNETLRSHARDVAARYSARREEKNARKKKRELEKEQKELEKLQLKEEKARLKKLRVEEIEAKVRKIKRAAGLKSGDIRPEDWTRFVDDEWDDAKWEEEMQHRFGEEYYAEEDVASDEEAAINGKRKLKKPKFDDDININDIVPDFKEDEGEFSLSEEEAKPKKSHKKMREEKKRDAKKERRIIEQLVDDQVQLELNDSLPGKNTVFRYRETSPQSFGLNARDILMADDSQLNQFAGLKKLASFRDPEKKRKDKKHLGKKARLRMWRKETFGNEDGPREDGLPADELNTTEDVEGDGNEVNIRTTGKKKRRRSKKRQVTTEDVTA